MKKPKGNLKMGKVLFPVLYSKEDLIKQLGKCFKIDNQEDAKVAATCLLLNWIDDKEIYGAYVKILNWEVNKKLEKENG